MATKKNNIYDSGVNIMGSIPDYNVMLDYISDTYALQMTVRVHSFLERRSRLNVSSLL
jgi:hypothetical protein